MNQFPKILKYFPLITLLFILNCRKNPTEPGNDSAYNWELSKPEGQGMNSEIFLPAFILMAIGIFFFLAGLKIFKWH